MAPRVVPTLFKGGRALVLNAAPEAMGGILAARNHAHRLPVRSVHDYAGHVQWSFPEAAAIINLYSTWRPIGSSGTLRLVFLEGAAAVGKSTITKRLDSLGYRVFHENYVDLCNKARALDICLRCGRVCPTSPRSIFPHADHDRRVGHFVACRVCTALAAPRCHFGGCPVSCWRLKTCSRFMS